jgi:hypothetical protein
MPDMRWIRNLHLRTKLILMSAITVGLALVLACAGFLLNDLRLLQDSKLRQLRMQAELLSFNSCVPSRRSNLRDCTTPRTAELPRTPRP